jgi:hypothetical protein
VLCKHEVTGSIPVSSTNHHCVGQMLADRSQEIFSKFNQNTFSDLAVSGLPPLQRDGNPEAGSTHERMWVRTGFMSLRARLLRRKRKHGCLTTKLIG